MLSRFFQHSDSGRLERQFQEYFEKADGSPLQRSVIAMVTIELEDPWVACVTKEFSEQEQPIFLMAYQCFLLWLFTHALGRRLQPLEFQEITVRLREHLASFAYHNHTIFEGIWPHMQKLMPIALRGGAETEAVYPLPHIIQAAVSAGYPLPQKAFDYEIGLHVLMVMSRVWKALNTGN